MTLNTINAGSVVCRRPDVVFSKLDDELLAIDSEAGYCYSMNETAGRIWDLIATPVLVGELCSRLMHEFTVDEQTCLNEVLPVLQRLKESDLIQVNDAQSGPE